MAEKNDPAQLPFRIYPWHEWTDGSWWTALHGTDYKVTTEVFRSVLYKRAARHGMRVTTRFAEGGITFRFERRPADISA